MTLQIQTKLCECGCGKEPKTGKRFVYQHHNIGKTKHWTSFEEARKFARSLGLKKESEWIRYCKQNKNKIPDNIPIGTGPRVIYKNRGWLGMPDFLGFSPKRLSQELILPFEEAKKEIQKIGLSSRDEFLELCRQKRLPKGVPTNPGQTYRGKGWRSWPDFLGNDRPTPIRSSDILPFEKARAIARQLGIKTEKEWRKYRRFDERIKNIPSAPDQTYRNGGWTSWYEFLGHELRAIKRESMLPFEEAREKVQSYNIQSLKEFYSLRKQGKLPKGIPVHANLVYKNKGWKNWPNFLGYDFTSFQEARRIIRSLGIESYWEYQQLSKKSKLPKGIPSHPDRNYIGKGWIDWYDFLGNGILPFKEARKIARSLGCKSAKDYYELYRQGKLPKNMPRSPNIAYRKK
jgi:hypothetical protein